MERIPILHIPIDILSSEGVLRRCTELCRMAGQFHMMTPNPEMLVEASKNAEFKKVLQNSSLNIPDGVGLVWALRRVARRGARSSTSQSDVPQRITGTDTLLSLLSLQARLCPPERVFLLGSAPGIAERAAEELKRRNPAIKEIGTWSGSPKEDDKEDILRRINAFSPTLLFVAFGAPAQDLWIARNLAKMPSVKIAMGVGGALDFIAGKRKRAPVWMQRAGIEWLWRLILEPRRIGRIWNAVVVFPWLFLMSSRGADQVSSG